MDLPTAVKTVLRDVTLFSHHLSGVRLRSYQQEVALAVVDSVIHRKGLTFVVVFPRQSGKNELQAHIETYLLTLLQHTDAEIVKVSPTWKPQSLNAMRRLERILSRNLAARTRWVKEQGFIYRLGSARIYFLSAEPTASIVGATASTLLECDEAQDVLISKWDTQINPMAASTNATRVFWGTAWTSATLLAREQRLALAAQRSDGVRRLFLLTADDVRREVPAYGKFVDLEIARLGRDHPAVRTQYFSEQIDQQAGLFTPDRLALIRGLHPPAVSPRPGCLYAFLIDVGGETTPASPHHDLVFGPAIAHNSGEVSITYNISNPNPPPLRTDSTVLTVVEIDLTGLSALGPVFRTVHRRLWTGLGQPALYAQLTALAELWLPRRIVIDATGLGEGLAAFLERSFPHALVRFKFTQSSKSDLGWKFITLVETGRYKEHAPDPSEPLQAEFFTQAAHLTAEILPGPAHLLRYSVPAAARHPDTGLPLHDDLVLSAMLTAALADIRFGDTISEIITPLDPLQNLSGY